LSINVKDKINGMILNEELGEGKEVRILNNNITIIQVSGRREELLPVKYNLDQNYPNPFNLSTSIQYAIDNRQFVQLRIYDILGNEVATLVNEYKPAGMYNLQFTMNNLASGIYFYKLQAGSFVETKKMMLLK
jgi:hypothetical protein